VVVEFGGLALDGIKLELLAPEGAVWLVRSRVAHA